MKILVLYAGIGSESDLWDDSKHKIQHVEIDPKIAQVIRDRKPKRNVFVGDAVEVLLNNYQDFDFIWFSPPCQANSRMIRSGKNRKPTLPDLKLYELKIFLDYNNFKGKYVIENVDPYYDPPIKPTIKIGRHLFWSNFDITQFKIKQPKNFIMKGTVKDSEELKNWLGIHYEGNLYYKDNHDPCQVLRNCVHRDLGKHIYDCFEKTIKA